MALSIGARIRVAREERGWTQAELAEKVGVSRETIGNWETDQSSPRNKLGRVTKVLGLADPETVGGTSDTSPVLLDLPDDLLAGMSPTEQEEVKAAARLAAYERARQIRGE